MSMASDTDRAARELYGTKAAPAAPTPTATTSDMRGAMVAAFKAVRDRVERGGELAGAASGFRGVDIALDGWQRGKLYVVGGRSGMGKSVFGLNTAMGLARAGEPVHFMTIEMPTVEQAQRAMFCASHVPSYRWKNGSLRQDDWAALTEAINDLCKLKWLWDESSSVTVEQIRAKVKQSKATLGRAPAIVVIDHVLNIKGSNDRQPRREQLLHITQQLKSIAKDEDVCVIALTQLNRALEQRGVKDKRPQISDLKESGSFEEDADAILLLYRADHYERDKAKWTNELEVLMPKVRGGEPSYCKLNFNGACYRLDNLEHGEDFYRE
jgi:replicative DNA helicase